MWIPFRLPKVMVRDKRKIIGIKNAIKNYILTTNE